ncbi:MAG TPA: PEGA domain-containing protein, partial [Polyangia bacterium]
LRSIASCAARVAFAALALVSTLALARPAEAAPRRVAVLRVEFNGGMAANNEDFLRLRLMEGLASADFQVFGGLPVSQLLKQGSRLESCRQESCYQEIARSLGVEYLVTGVVSVDRKNYEITLELISGRDGKTIDKYTEPCQLCGISEVGTKVSQLVQAVRRGADTAAAAAPGRYAVESRPPGAKVTVDGKEAGITPLAVELAAGAHRIAVEAPGYQSLERMVNTESGSNGLIAVDLTPAGGGSLGEARPWRMLAWTAMALGAVAVGVGFVVLHYHGQFIGCLDPPMSGSMGCNRSQVRQTELEAGALIGAGGMLAVSGATLLFLAPSDAPTNVALSRRPGFIAGIRGSF